MTPDLSPEITYQTSRSGGKGGQNVNKVETAVTASWSVAQSTLIDDAQRVRLLEKLSHRIDKAGAMSVRATDTRSQLENKALATQRLQAIVAKALVVEKARKKTRPGKGAVIARLESKARESQKKAARRKEQWT